jgi:hypothetical protein
MQQIWTNNQYRNNLVPITLLIYLQVNLTKENLWNMYNCICVNVYGHNGTRKAGKRLTQQNWNHETNKWVKYIELYIGISEIHRNIHRKKWNIGTKTMRVHMADYGSLLLTLLSDGQPLSFSLSLQDESLSLKYPKKC